jgi:hypothetical protein
MPPPTSPSQLSTAVCPSIVCYGGSCVSSPYATTVRILIRDTNCIKEVPVAFDYLIIIISVIYMFIIILFDSSVHS